MSYATNSARLAALVFSIGFTVTSPIVCAEDKGKQSATGKVSCEVVGRTQSNFFAPQVFEFGALKIKVQEEKGVDAQGRPTANYSAVFDLKAPGYLKRGLEMRIGDTFTDTICGSEVSLKLWTGGRFEVSSF